MCSRFSVIGAEMGTTNNNPSFISPIAMRASAWVHCGGAERPSTCQRASFNYWLELRCAPAESQMHLKFVSQLIVQGTQIRARKRKDQGPNSVSINVGGR